MSEICKNCFERENPDWIVTKVSRDFDLCESCGQQARVVIRAREKYPPLDLPIDHIREWLQKRRKRK